MAQDCMSLITAVKIYNSGRKEEREGAGGPAPNTFEKRKRLIIRYALEEFL